MFCDRLVLRLATDQACRSLPPQRGEAPAQLARDVAAGLKLAHCMRSYGFPGFPGPAAAGHAGSQCRAQQGRDGMVAAGELDTVGLSWTLRDMFQRCVALTRRSPGLRTPRGQNTVFTRRGMEKRQVSGHSDG